MFGMEIAVKKLSPEGRGLVRSDFESEIKVLMGIPNPRLVRMCGYCREGDELCLVYEYMRGGSLEDLLRDQKRKMGFKFESRTQIAYDVACGLAFLHYNGIVHLDIKPDNILIDQNGRACIADCGLAKILENGSTIRTKLVSGTPCYIAPEAEHGVISPSADVYSFGVVLLRLLTGKPPFVAEADQTLPELAKTDLPTLIDPCAEWPQHVAEELGRIALDCLKSKKDYKTGKELRPPMESIMEAIGEIASFGKVKQEASSSLCPAGHQLVEMTGKQRLQSLLMMFYCNRCSQRFYRWKKEEFVDKNFHYCKQCDYDVCSQCWNEYTSEKEATNYKCPSGHTLSPVKFKERFAATLILIFFCDSCKKKFYRWNSQYEDKTLYR
eukprot:TRINITY_DN3579_c0_g1_i2.p1 TRINITY_DN3579_c0_g1~~TRINITY_DN3579_c0_g1_i2.p1  ORF type:complete len:382 (-),score=83.03 TRINITY_DN3579_c0_g1_i2:17-1162(-)